MGSNCVTVPNFVTIDRTAADIWRFFEDGGRRRLGFVNFRNLTVGTIEGARLRQLSKFRGDWPNGCRYIAIFRFFKDGGCLPS